MICPVCQTSNSNTAIACRNCGGTLPAETVAAPQHQTEAAFRPPLINPAAHGTATVTAPIPIDRLQPGQMLGWRYRIEAEAGHGGMGRVYRATDLELSRTVALKVMRAELAEDPVFVGRLKQEIRLASEISHPHVLRIHDLGEASGIQFISMAWVEGEDLQHFITRHGHLEEQQVLRIAAQLCEGLQAAHEKNIIHRDLKPQNILIDTRGDACIADFGLAQSVVEQSSTHLTQTGHVVGSPRYMSPEQLSGKPVDHRTDIYSLGMVFYEMATGETPDLTQRLSRASSARLANPAISEKLDRIISRCLEPDPGKRYASVAQLLQAFRTQPEPIATHALSRRTWSYAAAGLAVIALVALFTLKQRPGGVPPLTQGKYIAVLPFAVKGSEATLKLYSQGITDALAARLFTLEDVHTVSQAAVERADLTQPVEKIARQVGANVIADGIVEARDGALVVHSRLIGITQHKTLSEDTFSGDASALLEIENSIYKQIAATLGARVVAKPAIDNLTAHPTRNPEAYDLYLQGREVLKEKRNAEGAAEALAFFEKACAKDFSFALAWTGVADASLQIYRAKREGFWAAKALDAARHAASNGNDLPEVHFTLGSVYTATGKNAEAVEELKRALALDPNSDNGYLRLGRAYLATGQSEAALGALRKAVDLNPYYWYNHDQLGLAFYRMGRNKEALAEFKNAADLNPNNATEYNRIGATYFRMGRLQDSIEQFKKVIKLQPSADAYTNLGTAYFDLARYREAIVNFKKAAQMNDKNVLYMSNLADAYKQAGQGDEAAKANAEAIRLAYQQLQVNPQDSATMGELAMCYAHQGELEKAAEFARRARSIDAADNQLMYDEAAIDALGGKSQQALLALRQAFENGYSVEEAKTDSDLKLLRDLPEYRRLVENYARPAETRR